MESSLDEAEAVADGTGCSEGRSDDVADRRGSSLVRTEDVINATGTSSFAVVDVNDGIDSSTKALYEVLDDTGCTSDSIYSLLDGAGSSSGVTEDAVVAGEGWTSSPVGTEEVYGKLLSAVTSASIEEEEEGVITSSPAVVLSECGGSLSYMLVEYEIATEAKKLEETAA